jgi:AraC-like DNA-binding protein
MPQLYLHRTEADLLEAAGKSSRQPAWGLLSCANSLFFCASNARPGEQTSNECNKHGGLVRASRPTTIHSMPSATGGIARLVCARMRESGVPLNRLLSKAGLTVEQIANRSIRLKARSQIKLLELAADSLQDDLLGFHLARDYDLREIGLLYYVLASSEILNEALHKVVRYSGVANEGVSLKFSATKEAAITLNYIGVERQPDRHHIEFWLVSVVRLCRQLTNRRLVPSRVRVIHHRRTTPAKLRSFLGCEIEFASSVDEIVFPGAVKLMPIISADPHLNELLIRYCEEALEHRRSEHTTLRSSVENAMAPLLPHGKATAVEIARQIGMSHRTLARKLSSEGLTFSEISKELKVNLAKHYLGDGDLPISQVAWLLGYREISAFTHAFKRWTGMTPSQLRAHGNQRPFKRIGKSRRRSSGL